MNTLMVGYDLNQPGKDYTKLIDKLKTFPSWWHHLDSTWLIKTPKPYDAIRDELKPYVDSSDELLVVDVTGRSAAWTGLSEKGGQWIKDNL